MSRHKFVWITVHILTCIQIVVTSGNGLQGVPTWMWVWKTAISLSFYRSFWFYHDSISTIIGLELTQTFFSTLTKTTRDVFRVSFNKNSEIPLWSTFFLSMSFPILPCRLLIDRTVCRASSLGCRCFEPNKQVRQLIMRNRRSREPRRNL